ncbi:Ig-like domain-containing protein, partial [Aeromicrobium sp. LTX1]|uniref:Ig-like domain-containing protein n=1 Tax=Aeromicrobium sp. LTX1 TaxID=3389798 RepID=UPI00396AFD57
PYPNQTEPGEYYLNYANIPQVQVIKGESCQFEGFAFCNGRPMFDAKGTWESSDPEIGTIDANGLFTAKSVGFTTIKFQATD